MTHHLVMWSGGPDSTLALKEALKTPDKVSVVHVQVLHHPHRAQAEFKAVSHMTDFMRPAYRYFDLYVGQIGATMNYDTGHKAALYSDICVMAPFAGMVANQLGDITKTWLGEDVYQNDGFVDNKFRLLMAEFMFTGRDAQGRPQHLLPPQEHSPRPGQNRTKQQIRDALGDELWAMTFSCRGPDQFLNPCNTCPSCIERKETRGKQTLLPFDEIDSTVHNGVHYHV